MYLGSVRFFRHLIIVAFLLFITIPVIGTGVLCIKYAETRSQLDDAVAVINSYSEKQDELKTEFEKLSNNVRSQITLLQPQINVAISDQMAVFQQQLHDIISDLESTQQELDAMVRQNR